MSHLELDGVLLKQIDMSIQNEMVWKFEQKISVEGVVTALTWSETGEVLRVKLSGIDELDYLILPSGCETELKNYLNRRVVVVGDVTEYRSGQREVFVTNIFLRIGTLTP